MSKYTPLKRYLERQSTAEVPMSFADVERVLGFSLPRSARSYPAWWANDGTGHVNAQAWLEAGWKTIRVDVPGERVVFVREGSRTGDDGGIPLSGLSPAALRMIDDYAETLGCGRAEAAAHALNAAATERRKAILDWFAQASPPMPTDSVDLIREDRDAR